MRALVTAVLTTSLTGCWKVDRSVLPEARSVFAPNGVEISGWVVTETTVGLRCPDGEESRFLFVHPEEPETALDTAVVFHSGSFDYVVNPSAATPLLGEHLQDVTRLEMSFAVRMAYATLGMFPSPLETEAHTGALSAALVDRDVALVLPTNCWGDLWHNEPGAADNAFEDDFFFRSGRPAAEWPFRLLAEPAFADALGVELPFEPTAVAPVAIGLGEGGRAIGEILHIDDDADGTPDRLPRRIAVDSLLEDLSVVTTAVDAGPGLDRIFPGGDVAVGALNTAPTLPDTIWIHSPQDTQLAEGSQDAMLARLQQPRHTVLEQTPAMHVFSNADDALAAEVVDFLLQ